MPINILMRAPAFLMGADFTGWEAAVFFLLLGTLDAIIGIALLRLATWSRILAIYFFAFRIVNTALTFLLPGSRARFEEGIAAMQAALGQHYRPRSPVWFGAVFEVSLMAVVLWFLFTRKEAFLAPEEGPALAP